MGEDNGFFKDFFLSRTIVLIVIYVLLFVLVLSHFFRLQIINGEEFQDSYAVSIIKEKTIPATRGNIYDRNGNVLAYNELSYSITIEDNGTYESTDERNRTINETILFVLHTIDAKGDVMDNDFGIELAADGSYVYNLNGFRLERFRADIYGAQSYSDLKYSEKLGYNPAHATEDQIMDYLCTVRFGVDSSYERADQYRIAIVRYEMSLNSYRKYISTTIASNVSEETVAVISEHLSALQGIEIQEDTIRRYNDAKYFASIIGYTGKISEAEYTRLSEQDDSYSLTDVVGKAGIEQYMDSKLKGTKGLERVYVDNLGKVLDTLEKRESRAGNNIYLSLDRKMQIACYDLLEQEIAGILYSKIIDAKEYEASGASDIKIPIYDVYFALINNNLIDIRQLAAADAGSVEQNIYRQFTDYQRTVLARLEAELTGDEATVFGELDEDMASYESYCLSLLQSLEVYDANAVDPADEVYQSWKDNEISLQEYLRYVVREQWVDVTKLEIESRYSDSEEVYDILIPYLMEALQSDTGFAKRIYKYMIKEDLVTGVDLALLLFDMQVLPYDDEMIERLHTGEVSAYDFFKEKIASLSITPADLALYPCSGSVVITDVRTGELLVCVSYPGYDNNKLANTVDAAYYNKLYNDLSSPFYNNATQEKTAPGSTFKMVTAAAGLTEQAISIDTEIVCEGQFNKVENGPRCWIYPSTHGTETIVDAIKDSCNSFFYEVGWRLSQKRDSYDEATGIEKITKYAELFGLGEKTGIEISESEPEIAGEYPITAAIGQSNHNFTTISLARYITAVANRGSVYQFTLLNRMTDSADDLIESYTPQVDHRILEIGADSWDAIQLGNLQVCQNMSAFDELTDAGVSIAGKTGTAQQLTTRPNHALFLGYAPYENPQIAVATRIAYGYTSHNTADLAADIFRVYFGTEDYEKIVTGQAANTGNTANAFTD